MKLGNSSRLYVIALILQVTLIIMYFFAIFFLILVAAAFISSISDYPIKTYCDSSLCGKGSFGSLTEFSIDVSPIDDCELKVNVSYDNVSDFYPTHYCADVSNKCSNDTKYLIEGLVEQLEAIFESFYSYPAECLEILQRNNLATSGYHTIRAPNGSFMSVYCDMEGSNCDGQGGWMRVGYLNMSEPCATCPSGLTLRQFNNIDHGLCGRPMSSSITYSTYGVHYSKVYGQIRSYQYNSPDGFPPLHLGFNKTADIDNCDTYVDGVTITYSSNPRKHIWTYAGGLSERLEGQVLYWCPCNNGSNGTTVPSFVGSCSILRLIMLCYLCIVIICNDL